MLMLLPGAWATADGAVILGGGGGGGGAGTPIGVNKWVVGPAGTGAPYTQIQPAIDAAVLAGFGPGNPAVVVILPGSYTGNVTCVGSISLRGLADQSFMTVMTGDVTWSAPAPGQQLSIQELVITGHFIFGGTSEQQIWLDRVAVQTTDASPC